MRSGICGRPKAVTRLNKKFITPLCCITALLLLLSACGSSRHGESSSLQCAEADVSEQANKADSLRGEPMQTTEAELGADHTASGEELSQWEPKPPSAAFGQAMDDQTPEDGTAGRTDASNSSTALETPDAASEAALSDAAGESVEVKEENTEMKMNVQIGTNAFTATLEDNAAVDALVEWMESGPLVIQMRDYAGFEKVGPLGTSLPTSNSQTTTQAGDIVLYQGNQIVIFYGSNSWSYTRLGRIDDLTGWTEALGDGDVTVIFSVLNSSDTTESSNE